MQRLIYTHIMIGMILTACTSPVPTSTVIPTSTSSVLIEPAATQPPTQTSLPTPTPTQTSIPFIKAYDPHPDASDYIDPFGVPMRLIPAGEFVMGSENGFSNEKPVHIVALDDFYMDKYEVTNASYKACVETGACDPPKNISSSTRTSYYDNPEFDDYPVIFVDWTQARAYCEWRGGRLPTEAEWEKAAGGRGDRTYPWGEEIDKTLANYDSNVGDTTVIGSYERGNSVYGIYDMAGNVWEWVADWHSDNYYQTSPSRNPLGPDSGELRVLRGGSWSNTEDFLRASNRYQNPPDGSYSDVGFRCTQYVPDQITDAFGVPMQLVPAGDFIMGGDPDAALAECQKHRLDCEAIRLYQYEAPPHTVFLDAFYIDIYEVTNARYAACVNVGRCDPHHEVSSYSHPSYYGNPEFHNYPVINVTWDQAKTYCEWRNAGLPTEAQWEKAARGTDGRTYPWGNAFDGSLANFCDKNCTIDPASGWPNTNYDDGFEDVAPVGSYPNGVSPYGLYDMSGNVQEWVADWFSEGYDSSPSRNPVGSETGEDRVQRGGSWHYTEDWIRTSTRSFSFPGRYDYYAGFRCARSLSP